MARRRPTKIAKRAGIYLGALVCALFFGMPLVWMVSTSLKPEKEWLSVPPKLIPAHPTLANFTGVIEWGFPRYFLNSLIVSAGATVLTIVLAVGASYALARLKFRGSGPVLMIALFSQLLPTAVLIVPLFRIARDVGLVDTFAGVIIIYLSFDLPVAIWLLRSYFVGLPWELEEAAQVDGATKFGAFRRALLPLAVPGVVATVAYVFFASWQEFVFALTILSTSAKETLPVAIYGFIGQYSSNWGELMAASVLLLIPTFLLFGLLQRRMVRGLTQGAVKG